MSKCMLQCLLIFALQTLLMFCFVRFYFVFLSASCMYWGCETSLLWGTFSDSLITGYGEKYENWNHFLMNNKWLYSFALVDPLSLNLHLRFYTMVDRKFEQHWCFTINYLFICTNDYYPLIEWWMNWICVILHTSMIYNMPPWCQRELLFRQWMLR